MKNLRSLINKTRVTKDRIEIVACSSWKIGKCIKKSKYYCMIFLLYLAILMRLRKNNWRIITQVLRRILLSINFLEDRFLNNLLAGINDFVPFLTEELF